MDVGQPEVITVRMRPGPHPLWKFSSELHYRHPGAGGPEGLLGSQRGHLRSNGKTAPSSDACVSNNVFRLVIFRTLWTSCGTLAQFQIRRELCACWSDSVLPGKFCRFGDLKELRDATKI